MLMGFGYRQLWAKPRTSGGIHSSMSPVRGSCASFTPRIAWVSARAVGKVTVKPEAFPAVSFPKGHDAALTKKAQWTHKTLQNQKCYIDINN
ncbi:hypothetical protein I79_009729 [Cricetulus griseus]|uniref:Uncharacterized protein n=1 Tax=Cricetulus griseus TaxID=10029 RepID=G3HGJ1_CRIGR|nr:hypothetical protein I79_009729 [Cricetulus griseus]